MAAAGELRIDGSPASLDDLTRIALVNYGAFTSFAAEGGCVRGLDLHLARLQASALELFGEAPGEGRLRDLIQAALTGREAAWVRVSLFAPEVSPRSADWRGLPKVMTAVFPPAPPLAGPVRLAVQTYVREAPHLKHVATFGLVRARRLAREAGFDDALFVDPQGAVLEGSLWNIGFLAGDRIVWPRGSMLAGVAQALIRRGWAGAGLPDGVEPVRLPDLGRFEGAFICNSATPAAAVAGIGDHVFPIPSAALERLRAAWASNSPQPI